MGLVEILGILAGIIRMWPTIVEVVKAFQKTPAEKHAELLNSIKAAAELANTKKDTSGYESILRG